MAETTDSAQAKAVTSSIMEVAVDAAIAAAQAAVPILRTIVIKQLFEFFVDRIAALIETELANYAAFLVIEAKNDAAARTANQAAAKLKAVVADPHQPQAAVDSAKQDFKDALKNLIRTRPANS